ncbi:MAG TPA: glycosyltransferase family 39 protein [Blastocatellia bacterium]|nr:glycosyltransferase family 39 protein [Blastocatellia bacterium]
MSRLSPSDNGVRRTITGQSAFGWFSGPAIVVYLAAIKLLVHIATAASYGLFTDELYFLACGERLAWGYVDMPPLTALQAWLARELLGDSLYAIHLFPALAGAGLVLLTGAIARELGGGRYAQALAALVALVSPGWLAVHAYLSMNSIELLLVAGCALVLIRMINSGNTKLWLVFGALAGLGMLNKHTMILFGFALIASLLLTRERRLMKSRWFAVGGTIAFLIFLPNLVWMWQHHFPHLELLANIRRNQRNVSFSFFDFMGQQVLFMHPAALPVWLGGLWHFLVGKDGRRFRTLGLAYLVALGILLAADGRTYYLLPGYPMLIAGGATAIERWLSRSRLRWAPPTYAALIAATGAMLAPLALPALPPETYIMYSGALGISQPRLEHRRTSALPQLFADRFGWPEMAQAVAAAYHAIPEPEREKTAIFGQDYGQGGAIDFYGPKLGLPKAISGHLTYWYWGPREYTGEIMLVMGDRREVLEAEFETVEKVGEVGHPYAMASQHWELFLCRGPKGWSNLQEIWPRLKNWN